MIEADIDLDELVEEAAQVTESTGPTQVLLALTETSDPFERDDNSARKNLEEAIEADLGAIYRHERPGSNPDKNDRAIWIDRISWFLGSMRGMKDVQASDVVLRAMLLISDAFKRYGSLWNAVPQDLYTANLLNGMSALIARSRYTIDFEYLKLAKWEHNAILDFLKAYREGDLSAIAISWNDMYRAAARHRSVLPRPYLWQAVVCLNAAELGQEALDSALNKIDVLCIMLATDAMTPSQVANVMQHSTSKRTCFVLILAIASKGSEDMPFEENVIKALAGVFRTAQRDPDVWTRWMQALNRYRSLTARIQPALGASLVNSSDAIKSTYVYSINLQRVHIRNRESISECFEEFRKHALLDDRQSMWSASHRRWSEWDFDRKSRLSEIAFCDLDYAIIGYYVECLSDDEIKKELETINEAFIAFQDEWYKDHQTFKDEWCRLLSRYQIAIYADAVRHDEKPWELQMQIYFPFVPETDRYAAMTFETQDLITPVPP